MPVIFVHDSLKDGCVQTELFWHDFPLASSKLKPNGRLSLGRFVRYWATFRTHSGASLIDHGC